VAVTSGRNHTHGKVFVIADLWIHATIKLVTVIGILKNPLWAYALSLITLGLLMLHQVYFTLFVRLSVRMIILTPLRHVHPVADLA
jgi:uncharacterized membrane protein